MAKPSLYCGASSDNGDYDAQDHHERYECRQFELDGSIVQLEEFTELTLSSQLVAIGRRA
jgi:hypothetical protein